MQSCTLSLLIVSFYEATSWKKKYYKTPTTLKIRSCRKINMIVLYKYCSEYANPSHWWLRVFLCPLPSRLLAEQRRPGPLFAEGRIVHSKTVPLIAQVSLWVSLSTSSINKVEDAITQTNDTWYQETRKLWRFWTSWFFTVILIRVIGVNKRKKTCSLHAYSCY